MVAVIRVMVVDDHAMFAASVATLLALEADVAVVATVGDIAAARRRLATEPVDVVLLDRRLPDGAGIEAAPELLQIAPAAHVVVLTSAADDASVLRAMERGCAGVLEKDRAIDELVRAVRTASAGGLVLRPEVLARLVTKVETGHFAFTADLTSREHDVLGLLTDGLDVAQVAGRLDLGVDDVQLVVAAVGTKVRLHAKVDALSRAVGSGAGTRTEDEPS